VDGGIFYLLKGADVLRKNLYIRSKRAKRSTIKPKEVFFVDFF